MRKHTLYLSHTITIRKEVAEWERLIESTIRIDLMNPFYDLGEECDINRIDSGDPYKNIDKKLATRIVNRDLAGIDMCDGLLAYIKTPSFGVAMEIYHCKQLLMKPVYIYLEDKSFLKHPWLMYFSDHIYTDMDVLIEKLVTLQRGIMNEIK